MVIRVPSVKRWRGCTTLEMTYRLNILHADVRLCFLTALKSANRWICLGPGEDEVQRFKGKLTLQLGGFVGVGQVIDRLRYCLVDVLEQFHNLRDVGNFDVYRNVFHISPSFCSFRMASRRHIAPMRCST